MHYAPTVQAMACVAWRVDVSRAMAASWLGLRASCYFVREYSVVHYALSVLW